VIFCAFWEKFLQINVVLSTARDKVAKKVRNLGLGLPIQTTGADLEVGGTGVRPLQICPARRMSKNSQSTQVTIRSQRQCKEVFSD